MKVDSLDRSILTVLRDSGRASFVVQNMFVCAQKVASLARVSPRGRVDAGNVVGGAAHGHLGRALEIFELGACAVQ